MCFVDEFTIIREFKRQVELFYILAPHKHCTYFDIALNSRILYDKANVKTMQFCFTIVILLLINTIKITFQWKVRNDLATSKMSEPCMFSDKKPNTLIKLFLELFIKSTSWMKNIYYENHFDRSAIIKKDINISVLSRISYNIHYENSKSMSSNMLNVISCYLAHALISWFIFNGDLFPF